MVDIEYLTRLLSLLKSSGVSSFRMADLEIGLGSIPAVTPTPVPSPPLATAVETAPEFHTDDIFNYDKILNWSGSPDPLESELPLTGEVPEVI